MSTQNAKVRDEDLKELYGEAIGEVVQKLGKWDPDVRGVGKHSRGGLKYSDDKIVAQRDEHGNLFLFVRQPSGLEEVYHTYAGGTKITRFQPGPDITDHLIQLVSETHGGPSDG